MSKKTDKLMSKPILPRLRFPEFRDMPIWIEKSGDRLFKQISNKNHNSDLPVLAITQDHGAVPREQINYHVSVSEKSIENYKVVEEDDFIISLRSFQGGIEYSRYKGLCSPVYVVLRKRDSKLPSEYFRHFFKNERFIKDLTKYIEGLRDGKMISYKQFSDVLISVPENKKELEKIAGCLSSVDDLIKLETEKLNALKEHKIGLLQRLFPAEGEDLPTFRFPEFRGAAGWITKPGGDVFVQISNKNHDSNLPILAITQEHGAIPRDQINYHVSVSEKSIESYKIVEIGDFIISLRSFQGGIEYSKYTGLCSPAYVILRNKTKALNCYFKHFFKTERFIRDMTKNIEGLRDGKMVSYKQFSELMLPFPSSENEQRKIAECLSTADEMVAAQFQIVETLKEHKKGLMQQLFPSPKEVVG